MMRRRRVLQLAEGIGDYLAALGGNIVELREIGTPTLEWWPLVLGRLPPAVEAKLGVTRGSDAITALIDLAALYLEGNPPAPDVAAAGALHIGTGLGTMLGGALTMDKAIDLLRIALPMFMGRSQPPPSLPHTLTPEEIAEMNAEYKPPLRKVVERLFAEAPKLTAPDGTPRADQAPALECHVVLQAGQAIQGSLSVTPEGTLRLLAPNQIGKPPRLVMVEHFFDWNQVADIAVVREVEAEAEAPRIHTS